MLVAAYSLPYIVDQRLESWHSEFDTVDSDGDLYQPITVSGCEQCCTSFNFLIFGVMMSDIRVNYI